MNKMRISGNQLFWLMSTMQVGMTILLTINPAIEIARQDAWISTAAAGIFGVFTAFVSSRLSNIFPHQTFVEYVERIIGRWLGKTVVFLYMLFWYSVLAIILRQYSELIVGTILPRTPLIVPILGMLLVAVYVTASGIEAIARCSEILGPFVLLAILIPLLLSIKDLDFTNILPIYVDSGWMTILKGSLPTSSFLGDSVLLMMVFAFVSHPKKGMKPAIWGVGTAAILTCAASFAIVSTLGHATSSSLTYPYFNLVRYLSYFDFVQNLDSLVIAIWIIGIFVKVSLYFFISTYGTAQWCGVHNWRKMMWVVAPLAVILALLPRDFIDSSVFFPQKIAIPFILPFHMLVMPLLLWGIAKFRSKGTN
ncbi:endospore germination permease [Paenibacillus solisilvae]|uniref:Endospore germination permease n=1 Tax=Paenibacillus solisilvae TaxID=2486751 RepID=A0ABW0VSX2_9BACL